MKPASGKTRLLHVVVPLHLLLLVGGCGSVPIFGSGIPTAKTVVKSVTSVDVDEIQRTVEVVAKTYKDITPEQEHYIGRLVAATLLQRYPPYANEPANRYLNLIGQSIALASERPETFGGYHFLIVDSRDANAFAAPGGLILVTRGLLRLCRDEDEVASVLAHEIIHVQERHALQAIHKDRLANAVAVLTTQAIKAFVGGGGSMVSNALEEVVGDIASVLIERGYSREMEREADEKAVVNLRRIGYDPIALSHVLKELDAGKKTVGIGFFKTHPSPGDRALHIETRLGGTSVDPIPPERKRRFDEFLGSV